VKSSRFSILLSAICFSLLILARTPAHAQKEVTPDRLPFPQADDRFDTILQCTPRRRLRLESIPTGCNGKPKNCWSSQNPCNPTCRT